METQRSEIVSGLTYVPFPRVGTGGWFRDFLAVVINTAETAITSGNQRIMSSVDFGRPWRKAGMDDMTKAGTLKQEGDSCRRNMCEVQSHLS